MPSSLVLSGAPTEILTTSGQGVDLAAITLAVTQGVGTVDVTNGLASITFTNPQTVPAGTILLVGGALQIYEILDDVVASTSATLTEPYADATNAAAPFAFPGFGITGTVSTTNGSDALTFTDDQFIPAGSLLEFGSQPGFSYLVPETISGTAGTLAVPFTGPTTAADTAENVTPIVTSTVEENAPIVARSGQRVLFSAAPLGSLEPTTSVLTANVRDVIQALGADRQPVTLVVVPANQLSL